VRRDFPPALELIVMRALEKRPEDRYQSAEEMRVDLEEFLADEGLRTGSRRMALYMKEIFPPEGAVADASYGEGGVPLEVRVRDDSEELNFDRRAPLSLRFEAAPPEVERRVSRYPAPVPTDDARPRAEAAGLAPAIAPPVAGAPGNPSAGAIKENGVGSAPATTSAAVRSAAPVMAGPGGPRLADAPDEAPKPAKNRLGWVILLVIVLGAVALAFVGTR
jgi:serine/threonine-protein kinase